MQVGKLRDGDIGHHLLTTDGQVVRLISILGPLLLVHTQKGRVYWPIQDIDRRISDDEARRIWGDAAPVKVVPVKKKKLVQPYKRVIRTDSEGIETVFPSIKEAAAQSGVSAPSISLVCNGMKDKVRGYAFRFDNSHLKNNSRKL